MSSSSNPANSIQHAHSSVGAHHELPAHSPLSEMKAPDSPLFFNSDDEYYDEDGDDEQVDGDVGIAPPEYSDEEDSQGRLKRGF